MIRHALLFLLVGWFVAVIYFAREGRSPRAALAVASRKLVRYTLWTVLLGLAMWALEKLFIYPS